MTSSNSFFEDLSESDINKIRSKASVQQFNKDELIFAEGDSGDSFYIVESGSVSVFLEENGLKKHINTLGSGEYFGEMSILNQDRRSASVAAAEDTALLCVDKKTFLYFTKNHSVIAKKIDNILKYRNEELILRENLISTTGVDAANLSVSFKGDPSLRETALFRERYESRVDKVMDKLKPKLEELLLNRCVYHLTINFNSGEIRYRSIFDPYRDEMSTVEKLVETAFIDRHFTRIPYNEKLEMIWTVYDFIGEHPQFDSMPPLLKTIFEKSHAKKKPITQKQIKKIIAKLSELRNIPSLYLRNISISMTQDAIRMQFNCDGTHIVNPEEYQRFIEENL